MPPKLAILKDRTFLLGVGAQKAGTTWLYYYLDAHPQVFVSPVKEMHFFGNRDGGVKWPINSFRKKLRHRRDWEEERNPAGDRQFIALRERIRMGGKMRAYRRFFRKRVADEPVFGEITPAYSMLKADEMRFVREQFPKTKIIFLMRNPADRLWSHMRFSETYETVEDLEPRIDTILEKPVYCERIGYAQTIRNLREVFSTGQVHYEFYEYLFTEPAMRRLCDFLQVDYRPADFSKERNVSVKMPLSPLLRPKMVGMLREQYDFVISEFDDRVPESWRKDLELVEI